MVGSKNLVVVYQDVKQINAYVNNSRTHTPEQINQVANSIKEFGFTNPILIDEQHNVIAGHARLEAAISLSMNEVPCIILHGLTELQKRAYLIADNQLALNAGWDLDILRAEIEALELNEFDIDLLGFDEEFIKQFNEDIQEKLNEVGEKTSMSEKFLIPPFSVFNAREGLWQERKKKWLDYGIESEVGRSDNLVFDSSVKNPKTYEIKKSYEIKIGRNVTWDEFLLKHPELNTLTNTSVFDPVLCEIAYRWFSPKGGVILDPFAGGSVRGIVAALLNRQYIGCDLRQEQVTANQEQWKELNQDSEYPPVWVCGDSKDITEHAQGVEADLVFTCPPYADLEVYSDDPRDLSTMKYQDFIGVYKEIISKSTSLLKENRFACIVVGEVRDKKGNYYNFVGDTIKAFIDAGLKYYNEAILVTPVGSLPVRAGKPFEKSRKLGKTHQNVLIFVKGDAKIATAACGEVDITMMTKE
ncbi:hypothetical protein BGI05_06195 [Snodgrassella alvi]|uniref:DNA methyltransferase n=1 Tax=Snodgrassella alvi TaxID=1196083 RepID=UPI000A033784|nr:DNA methyltransferase [Snodgrassella alvi]ORF01441.1 hypothetical protein BGH97_06850 [Snodgrassella alvi]ORF09258.1 hypothetical protein BGH99_02975 [Snodgrassella alvi]ORF12823.1 hypothetical protein BGI00_04800 [Snodgrassella alvi]ORF13434.1 hypothetical protein BGI02_07495 [Snodgrassella alvi]ORF20535.1 hypothetical protein BGI05_06195 [Snodgrassella alvi]